MRKGRSAGDLTIALLHRSVCAVQVAAVLEDKWGIYGWGWNSSGRGEGEHAEAACLRRSNRDRWERSTLYVAAIRRRKNGSRIITARPCEDCQTLIRKVGRIVYRDRDGSWKEFHGE